MAGDFKEPTKDRPAVDEEFSEDSSSGDNGTDDDAASAASHAPILQPQDVGMGDESEDASSHHSDEEQSLPDSDATNDDDDDVDQGEDADDNENDADEFAACYPVNPPAVEVLPNIEYPEDTPRSSPSLRNLDFKRSVQNNFVPFSKGMRGESYRRRTTYEHQTVMG